MKERLDMVAKFLSAIQRPYAMMTAWGVMLAMALLGKPVPGWLENMGIALTAFYFGDRAARKGNTPTPGGPGNVSGT